MKKTGLSREDNEELVAIRRDLHLHPELSFEEVRTAAVVSEKLAGWGYSVSTGIATTGVVATSEGSDREKTVLLRADMDALPIQELNDAPYCSRNAGVMHACGHDGHTAMALIAAKLMRHTELPGRIKWLFQPAEENGRGAAAMIEEGVLNDPKVDAAFGIHLWNTQPTGTIGLVPGPQMAAVDQIKIVIEGKGGHAAIPHETVDAVVVASHMVVALQTVVSRRINPIHPAVVTVASIHSGSSYNIIPQEAVLEGTARSFDDETWEALPKLIEETVAGVCQTFGASYTLTFDRIVPPTVNDPEMTELVRHVAVELVGEENVFTGKEVPTMGGEDFGVFLKHVPGCFAFVGSMKAKGLYFGHHNPRFDVDEAALPIGVELLMGIAKNYLGQS